VVDDNVDNRDLTQILLEFDGFDVRVAEDEIQAECILETHVPNLILMDIQLPGTDGLALTRRLRQRSVLLDVTIVALSAYAMAIEKENARNAGCDGYITKPIDTRTFSSTVRKYLDAPMKAAEEAWSS
jgi:two-component system cell cycle response regulator